MGRIYVDSYTARITRKDLYTVTLTLRDGTVIDDLEPRRLFPVSGSNQYITLLDQNEREVALVRDFAELDEGSEEALRECFAEFYRIPKITRILERNDTAHLWIWTVETDRGIFTFEITNVLSAIKLFYDKRVLITDSKDNRYEIPDLYQLDPKSQKSIQLEL